MKWGLILLTLILAAGTLGPELYATDPRHIELPQILAQPTWSHPFGFDQNGRDVFARTLHGARLSMTVAFVVSLLSVLLGLIIGTLSAWKKSPVRLLFVQLTDAAMAFPGFLLTLSLAALMEPGLFTLVTIMAMTSWASTARLVKAEVERIQSEEFVEAAQALGAHSWRVIFLHVWPQLVGVLTVQISVIAAGSILMESGLSFLGLGLPPDYPSWGSLISSGRKYLIEAPQICFLPGLFLLLSVYAFNLIAEGIRGAMSRS